MPETTVIIPTYNRYNYLAEAILSVQKQTYRDFELIIVDDGSDDDSAAYVEVLAPEALLIRQENRGPSAARNTGINASNGEFVTFLDSDDRWLPEKLSTQIDYMRDNPDAIVCYTDEIWIRNGRRVNQKRRHRKYSGWIFDRCVPLCIVSPSSVLMRRSFFESVGFFDEELPSCEDYDLWLRAALVMPFHFIPEQLIVKYGGHADQLSSQWGLDRYRLHAILKLLANPEVLTPAQTKLLRDTALEKCEILINGFKKRGNEVDAVRHQTIRQRLIDGSSLEQALTSLR